MHVFDGRGKPAVLLINPRADNGELSQEDVSKALKEMDEHMNPLGKQQ